MSWNYRLVKEKDYITLREVYYKKGKPWLCTDGGTTIGGEDENNARLGLELATLALTKPVLQYPDDFPIGKKKK